MTRTLFMGCALAVVVAVLAGCGGSGKTSASDQTTQKDAALYQIDQIEQTWHKAASTHNVNLMMTLWAPGAVFNIGTKTLTGKAEIRNFFATENKAFMPQNQWESDTPSYKIKTTVNGNKGTLYFECHYVDVATRQVKSVVGADANVARLNGHWLMTNSVSATPVLAP